MMISTMITASAENETVIIDGFECYQKNGNYVTEIDGEEYIVISLNLDNIDINSGANARITPYSPTTPPAFWSNSTIIDRTDGSRYDGTCNISTSDYCSPVIKGTTSISNCKYSIYCDDFILPNTYKMDVHVFIGDGVTNWQKGDTITVSFSIAAHQRVLISGTSNRAITGIAFKVLKDGSSGNSSFNYTVYQMTQ